jgi:hypothetical protein
MLSVDRNAGSCGCVTVADVTLLSGALDSAWCLAIDTGTEALLLGAEDSARLVQVLSQ